MFTPKCWCLRNSLNVLNLSFWFVLARSILLRLFLSLNANWWYYKILMLACPLNCWSYYQTLEHFHLSDCQLPPEKIMRVLHGQTLLTSCLQQERMSAGGQVWHCLAFTWISEMHCGMSFLPNTGRDYGNAALLISSWWLSHSNSLVIFQQLCY